MIGAGFSFPFSVRTAIVWAGLEVLTASKKMVAPEGIEPPPKVPETFVLSIKLRSQILPGAKIPKSKVSQFIFILYLAAKKK